jgi:hypothetical protein
MKTAYAGIDMKEKVPTLGDFANLFKGINDAL